MKLKGNFMPGIFFALLLVLAGTVRAGAQQSAAQDQLDRQLPELIITNGAEYAAYMAAINTVDLHRRKAALDDFLRQFPSSVMREHVEDLSFDLIVQLDNQRTAPLREQLRPAHVGPPSPSKSAQAPDNLALYTECVFNPFKAEEYDDHDYRSTRMVATARGGRSIEVVHGISQYIAYDGSRFLDFKAEKLENYVRAKQLLIENLKYLSADPMMKAMEPWPSPMDGFEVYAANPKQLIEGVPSIYMLFHDVDQTVVTLYLPNTLPESPKWLLREYPGMRNRFLKTYTACTARAVKASL
jgi:hypothetical protein